MRDYFSIGEVSKMTGFTINALRHYDKIGLCKPILVNTDTNYRYYHANQLFYFDIIRFAKKIGMPLEDLKRIFDTTEMKSFKDFLNEMKSQMEDQIEELKNHMIDIDNIQDQISTAEILTDTQGLYQREIGERDVVTSPILPVSINNRFVKQMEQLELKIQEAELTTTFESGTIYKLQEELIPITLYKGVILNFDTDINVITRIPAGTYLCINYKESNRQEALDTLLNGIQELQLKNPLIIDTTLLDDIFSLEDRSHELQVFVGDLI
ncbi:MAG: MerR family transcriptional regulator [Erysipelotrichaceae bacterium]|nr:MerR family transcriptional regulator [Erysipelotrichaceae bacterium]